MSNLGMYQNMVQWANMLGGPKMFLGCVGVVGYLVLRTGEAWIKMNMKEKEQNNYNESQIRRTNKIFNVNKKDDGYNEFEVGDKFKVLRIMDNKALGYVIGDNKMFFVPVSILENISVFRREKYL